MRRTFPWVALSLAPLLAAAPARAQGVTIDTRHLYFPVTVEHQISPPQHVTLRNGGAAEVVLTSVHPPGNAAASSFRSLGGSGDQGQFTGVPPAVPIGPGGHLSLDFAFAPQASGGITDHEIIEIDGGRQSFDVFLSGMALPLPVELDPPGSVVSFADDQYLGITSEPVEVGLRATTTAGATIDRVGRDNPEFTVYTAGLAHTLAANERTSFLVYFTPASVGARSGTIYVYANGLTLPVLRIPARGMGTRTVQGYNGIPRRAPGGGCSLGPAHARGAASGLLLLGAVLRLALRRRRRRLA